VTSVARSPWFVVPAPRPDALHRLFCIPFAGGGASTYVQWAAAFRDRPVQIFGVQLPGRENRLAEPAFTRIEPLVAALVDAIEPLLDIPFSFFGHSMGSLVAFEATRALRARGLPQPRQLFLSGGLPPHVPRDLEPMAHLDDRAFIDEVSKRYGGIPPAVLEHEELLAIVLPILRADISLLESYEFEDDAPLTCPILAYAGVDDVRVDQPRLRRWNELTSADVSTTMFPGGHFYLQSQRPALLEALKEHL
jgi:medium-chain acyl-[acyl-carrier-protein] hydrolase